MIAVTGATGFLGAHVVCRLLQEGRRVKALKRAGSSPEEFNLVYSLYFPSGESTGNLLWAEADILDVPALEAAFGDAEEVYHCAAVVSFVQREREMMMKVNVEGTANVVNACLNCGVKKLAYISSIAALGRAQSGSMVTEKTRWADSRHNSNYAISKYKAEMEVWRGVEEGLSTVIVNPGVILGSGKWTKGSCALFNMVNKGMPFYTHGVNGYVDVKDVARAAQFLMDGNRFNERFILVGDNMEMKWFLDTTAEALGRKKPFIRINRLLAELSWITMAVVSVFTGRKPAITKETARASLNRFYYSNDKITGLGFVFTPIKQTITETCTDFKNQNSNYK